MSKEILFALRALDKINSIDAQQKIQTDYLKRSYRKHLVNRYNKSHIYNFLYFIELFRLFLNTFFRQRLQKGTIDVIALISTKNQKRQIQYIDNILDTEQLSILNLQNSNTINFVYNFNIRALCRSFMAGLKLYRNCLKRSDVIQQKNAVLFICMYTYFLDLLREASPDKIIVANDHSPIPLALASAARNLGIQTIYIQHAHITSDMPALKFNAAILDGDMALQKYKELGAIDKTRIFYRGIEGISRPMKLERLKLATNLTVGVFVNIICHDELAEILDTLSKNEKISHIILREHPAFPNSFPNKLPQKVNLSAGRTLLEDADKCDFVIGGNSSFHLSVLKYGCPTVFYDKLDYINYDDYEFVKNQICFEEKNIQKLDFKKIIDFYSNNIWKEKFKKYDASYLEDPDQLNAEIKQYILD